MEGSVPGLQVKLDAAATLEGNLHGAIHQARMRAPVGFPADDDTPLRQPVGGGQRVGHLGRRVTAEVADAVGLLVGDIGQFLGADCPEPTRVGIPIVPVLAKQTVERTRGVEDRQVMPAPLGGPRTDPIRDAVGGERVAVPLEKAPFRGPRQMAEFAFADFSQTAVSSLPLSDDAFVDAQTAENPLSGTGRGLRKAKVRRVAAWAPSAFRSASGWCSRMHSRQTPRIEATVKSERLQRVQVICRAISKQE
jgi:hypothetical protein